MRLFGHVGIFAGGAVICGALLRRGPLGQQVLRRGIVFIDLAIAQVAGLGVIAAHSFGLELQGWTTQLAAVIAALLGVPRDRREDFGRWSDDIVNFLGGGDHSKAEAANREIFALVVYAQLILEGAALSAAQGRRADANPLYRQAFAIEEKALGNIQKIGRKCTVDGVIDKAELIRSAIAPVMEKLSKLSLSR